MSKITVIDAPCGAGKTTWAIDYINDNPDQSFIYVTPFKDEIKRIRDACGAERIATPENNGKGKLHDFNRLLSNGKSIAVTHVTFLAANQETLEAIEQGDYILIIDESLDVVMDYEQAANDLNQGALTKKDMRVLMENFISVDDDFRVQWTGKCYLDDSDETWKFELVERLTKLGRLYCVDETFLVAVFPPEMFEIVRECYVMTYMFDGSIMRLYCDMWNIPYQKHSIVNGTIIDYDPEIDRVFRRKIGALTTLATDADLTLNYNLTKSWYQSAKTDQKDKVRRAMRRFFESVGAHSQDMMWTCYKPYKSCLSGKGMKTTRQWTKADEYEVNPDTGEKRKLTKDEIDRKKAKLECYVPCNAIATNDYGDRWALAYMINLWPNDYMARFFRKFGVYMDKDAWRTCALIQWVMRSRLRKSEPVHLYIPNKQMRQIFTAWLEG